MSYGVEVVCVLLVVKRGPLLAARMLLRGNGQVGLELVKQVEALGVHAGLATEAVLRICAEDLHLRQLASLATRAGVCCSHSQGGKYQLPSRASHCQDLRKSRELRSVGRSPPEQPSPPSFIRTLRGEGGRGP